MGLAAAQIQFLALTTRQADCEYGISIDSMQKMALTREMSQLTSEYNSKLQSKNLKYYANGEYHNIDYEYLMAGSRYAIESKRPLKDDPSMVLTDYNGRVVLKDVFPEAIINVLGPNIIDGHGRGTTFSQDRIPEIIAEIIGDPNLTVDKIQDLIDDKKLESYTNLYNTQNSMSGASTGNTITQESNLTNNYKTLVDFFYPILVAAANNGWTTEYNNQMNRNNKDYNPNYVSDALISGAFQIMKIDETGNYDIGTSLTYFITADKVEERSDSQKREELTAWFEAEKAQIAEKETIIDLHIDELSTELEAIKQEMQSIQTFIDDAVKSVFDWGSG
jgi:hypothetical protein